MIAYAVAGGGVLGLLLVRFLTGRVREKSWLVSALRNLNRFFAAFAFAGVVFSGLQLWLAFSDDLEAPSQTIRALEVELAKLRAVASFLKPSPGLEVALYVVIILLFVAPFWATQRWALVFFSRYLRVVTAAYVWLTLLTSMTFFGSLVAGPNGGLAQRIAAIEHHIDRIDQRYALSLAKVQERLREATLPSLVESFEDKKEKDDNDWPRTIAMAYKLHQIFADLSGRYPLLFDGPPPPGPPPAPQPVSPKGPVGPPTGSAALALPLPDPAKGLHTKTVPALANLAPRKFLTPKHPLVERAAPTTSPNLTTAASLAIERINVQFTGRFQQFLQALPSKTVVVRLENVHATRPDWSEAKVQLLEAELAQPQIEDPPRRKMLASIGARAMGAAYETGVDAIMDIVKAESGRGIPLGFLAGFIEAVLNETVKGRIETAIDQHTAKLVSAGSHVAATVSEFSKDVVQAVKEAWGTTLRTKLALFRERIAETDKAIQEATKTIPADTDRLASEKFEPRWQGFETLWKQALASFPEAMRAPGGEALRNIETATKALPPIERLRRLDAYEEVWLTPAFPGPLAYLSAMLRCEKLAESKSRALADAALASLPKLLPAEVSSNDIDDAISSVTGDRKMSPAVMQSLRSEIAAARARSLSTADAASRFIGESRTSSPAQAYTGFVSSFRKSCVIKAELVTERCVNGLCSEISRTPVTIPCFR